MTTALGISFIQYIGRNNAEMYYYGCALTDKGIRKSVNQDSIYLKISDTDSYGQLVLAVVCDGIGGLEQGEVASVAVTRKFAEWYSNLFAGFTGLTEEILKTEWSLLISDVNRDLFKYGREQGIRIGTTLTTLLLFDNRYLIAQVGDSRAYIIDDVVRQLTEDHTFLNRELKAGRGNRESLLRDPRRNRLTRGVGLSDSVKPDFYFGTINQDEHVWMLCSDGLRRKITKVEFEEWIKPAEIAQRTELVNVATGMVDTARNRDETDNISVILIKADSGKTS